MKISNIKLLIYGFSLSLLRFLIFPIDDYPDIIYIYGRLLDSENKFSLAKLFNLDKIIFEKSCDFIKQSSIINDYIFGGGYYTCDPYPMSYSYFYFFILITAIFIFLILFFYKLSKNLFLKEQKIYSRLILNLIFLPSIPYFLLMLHPDVLYNFMIISFVLLIFYLSFKKKIIYIYPIFTIPYIYLIYNLRIDNQYLIFLFLLLTSFLSLVLSKQNFVIKFFNKLNIQINRFLNMNFWKIKKDFLYITIFITLLIYIVLYLRIKLLYLFSIEDQFLFLSDVTRIASQYTNEDNLILFSSIEKYPIIFRLFGTLQGLIISTTFGLKPSIFTTLVFFSSFFIGFLRCYSQKEIIPLFIKIYGLVLFLSVIIIISIFPFFSYTKYWIFLAPFLSLYMVFTPRLAVSSYFLVYLEIILKSSWISLS